MNEIIKLPTHYVIPNYESGMYPELERNFSVWDKISFRLIPIGLIYNAKKKELYVPGGASPYLLRKITGREIEVAYRHDPYDRISLRITKPPRSKLQKDMVKFLIGEEEFEYNKNHRQLSCNAETGEGKTYAAISTMTYMKCKAIIIVNRREIKDNWMDEISKFTDIDKTCMLDVTVSVMRKILEGKLDTKKYYVFTIVHRTIQALANTDGWDAVTKFFQKIKVGLKVYDEANMEFVNSVHIDCYTDTFKTLYLTANMERSGVEENKVFQRCFKEVPKFNQYELGYNQSKKHIRMLGVLYNSKPSIKQVSMCKNRMGFNSKIYSDYQIYDDSMFFEILYGVIDKFTIKNNMRTLILVSKINSAEVIAEELKKMYPNKVIGTYHSKINTDVKKIVKDNAEIIVATGQSLGFYATIKNLRCCINCEAFRFKATGNQASGRLRRLESGEDCFYVELVDTGFKSIRDQYTERKRYYAKLFKEIIELKY